jgi:hypothetical protein
MQGSTKPNIEIGGNTQEVRKYLPPVGREDYRLTHTSLTEFCSARVSKTWFDIAITECAKANGNGDIYSIYLRGC